MIGAVESVGVGKVGASLTEEEARRIFRQGEEAVVFALLQLAKQLQQGQTGVGSGPSTPSGMKPVYQKASSSPRHGKPGRKAGHTGARRAGLDRIDATKEHRLKRCPGCGGELKRYRRTRTRYTEDIPEGITPQVTEHVIHRDWCPRYGKHVEGALHLDRTLGLIRANGGRPALAINPATPLVMIEPVLEEVELVLVMTVNPGFAGQQLVGYTIDKIETLSGLLGKRGLSTLIEVDGNTTFDNIRKMTQAGANVIVAGTSCLYRKGKPLAESLRELAAFVASL